MQHLTDLFSNYRPSEALAPVVNGAELLGAQNQVHYGHKKEEKARKKKELI